MRIEQENQGSALKLKIIGDLDASSAIELDQTMKQALDGGDVRLLIDCQQLDYISSAGLGVFVSYLQDFKDKQGLFVFYGMKESVVKVFQILGLDKLTTIVDSQDDAKKIIDES